MTEARVPPQNIDAERAVIGGVLNGAKLPTLSHEDCYRPDHRLILEAMLTLEAKQQPIDYLTVQAELERMAKLQEAGGVSYLVSLEEGIPFTANVELYAQIVKQQAIKRKVISKCRDLMEMAFDPSAEAQEVLDKFQAVSLGINGKSSTGSTLKELAKRQLKQIERAYQSEDDLLGIPTGFKELDHITLGWQAPDLIVIAGRPSLGKTALGLDTARVAARNGVKVYFSSLEMSEEQLTMRLLSGESGISGRSLRRGRFPKGDWSRVVGAGEKIADLNVIIDDTSAISEMELARRVRRVKPGLLVVDYLQLMRSAQKADRKDLEIANITAGLKDLAKKVNIPVILLSQLNREVERRSDPRPRLSDLRDSGAIEQDADIVIGIHRNTENLPGVAELGLLKHRNGPLAVVKLAFREELTSFADLAKD